MIERKARKSTAKNAESSGEISDALIAKRAYERWMGRGCPISDGFEDWTAARSELEAERTALAAKPAARRKPAQPAASMH